MTQYVYDFDEPSRRRPGAARRQGRGLAEMTQLGVPVPAGLHDHDRRVPRVHARAAGCPTGLEDEIDAAHRASSRSGRASGSATRDDPLLVSVRSGAAVSMPGMMDTILNLGLNDDAVEGLARATGNPRFALDSYRRLIQMYGEVVDGIDGHRFEQALDGLKRERGVEQDVELAADDLRALVETFKGIYEQETGRAFPQDAREQLRRAVRAVFESWRHPRAQVYRRAYEIPDDLGTAVNVVQMVFGNKGERSGDRRRFTRDPSTGERGLYGEYLSNAQGEDVVAGIRTPEPLEEMRDTSAGRLRQLIETMQRLESTTATCRTSSSRSRTGRSTCCRRARRSGRPRPRSSAAVEMAAEGLITREEAVARIDRPSSTSCCIR